jgi:hypothetical protein
VRPALFQPISFAVLLLGAALSAVGAWMIAPAVGHVVGGLLMLTGVLLRAGILSK